MTTTYTFDVFCSLDGYGAAGADWTGYWGKQGPELLDRRLAEYGGAQRMVFGAHTYRAFARMLAAGSEQQEVLDPGSRGCDTSRPPSCQRRWRLPSTDRTRRSWPVTRWMSWRGSKRSPTCRCVRTAASR